MITRRTVVAAAALAPALGAAGFAVADEAGAVGEVHMTLSSGLMHQTVRFGAEPWTQVRPRLALDENVPVLLRIENDTGQTRSIGFEGPAFAGQARGIEATPGATVSVTFAARTVGPGAIIIEGTQRRPVDVRPSYFPHPQV